MPIFRRREDPAFEQFECGDVDFGGDEEIFRTRHPNTQRHYCTLAPDHTTDHRCECGWSWRKYLRGKKK